MDVEDAVGKGGDEAGGKQAHIAGEADQIDLVLAEAGDEVGVVVGAGAAFGDVNCGGKVEVAGGSDARGISDVGEDDGDFDVGEFSGPDRFGDGEEVGTATREENA